MKVLQFSLLAAVAAGVALGSPASAQKSVRDGIQAWQSGNYATAIEIWRPLAEKGDADAAFNMGQAYRLGRGVTTDLAAAQTWLEKAARLGHLDAQTTLGLLLFDSGNRPAALRWLKLAADKGEPRAMLVYGTALFNGDDLSRDPVQAYAYVSRSAAQGLQPAKATLEEMDAILPVDVRRKGVAVALGKARAESKTAASPVAAKPSAKPKGEPVPKPAAVDHSGGWRIQLGAFSKRSSAEALFKKLSVSAPVSGRKPFYVAVGAVTRLQVGPFPTRSAATAACTALASRGQACFAVEAR